MQIKLFAIARERAGVSETWLDVPSHANVGQAVDELAKRFPPLSVILQRAMLAVNREYAQRDLVLKENDELAVIPPVSGGEA